MAAAMRLTLQDDFILICLFYLVYERASRNWRLKIDVEEIRIYILKIEIMGFSSI